MVFMFYKGKAQEGRVGSQPGSGPLQYEVPRVPSGAPFEVGDFKGSSSLQGPAEERSGPSTGIAYGAHSCFSHKSRYLEVSPLLSANARVFPVKGMLGVVLSPYRTARGQCWPQGQLPGAHQKASFSPPSCFPLSWGNCVLLGHIGHEACYSTLCLLGPETAPWSLARQGRERESELLLSAFHWIPGQPDSHKEIHSRQKTTEEDIASPSPRQTLAGPDPGFGPVPSTRTEQKL